MMKGPECLFRDKRLFLVFGQENRLSNNGFKIIYI